MSIFGRFSDILNSNINAMLDKAEDPEKLVKSMIAEMESTLFNVRRDSAKTIADRKQMERNAGHLRAEVNRWQQRAEKAIAKGRDDLAKMALQEKHRAEESLTSQEKELALLDEALARLEHDISRLQSQLNQAIARREAIIARHNTVRKTTAIRHKVQASGVDQALARFERFESKIDRMESEVEAMELGSNPGLGQQIDNLEHDEQLEQELADLKSKLKEAS